MPKNLLIECEVKLLSLNEKDIIIFGKVLSELGTQIQANPNMLLEFINKKYSVIQNDKDNNSGIQIDLNDSLSIQDKQTYLSNFTTYELKKYIKENHFGVPAKPNKEKLINCIIRNTISKNKDVFLDYQTPVEKELKNISDKNTD